MTFDDEDEQEYTWTASADNAISYRDRGYVSFPVSLPASVVSGGCDYTFTLTALNGQAYAGNTVKGSFGAMINVGGALKAVITTDNQAADNTFRLLDANGNVVAEYGPFTDGEVTTNDVTITFLPTAFTALKWPTLGATAFSRLAETSRFTMQTRTS